MDNSIIMIKTIIILQHLEITISKFEIGNHRMCFIFQKKRNKYVFDIDSDNKKESPPPPELPNKPRNSKF